MQFSTSLLALMALGSSSVSARVTPRQAPARSEIPEAITNLLNQLPPDAPDPLDFFPTTFGVQRGIPAADGSANCQGPTPDPKDNINCSCPPDVDDPTFRAAVKIGLNNGFFPEPAQTVPINITQWNNNGERGDDDLQQLRNNVMVIALQSLQGVKGLGCPGISAPALKAGSG
ncbi:hypothetical protein V8F20_001722 [Naviculisporaceae sp. PSN 640]